MIEMRRAQLLKQVIGAMIDVDMSPMPPKVIRREACLQTKSPFGLSMNHGCKKHSNIL
jgi:hypothetical protein